MTQYPHYRRPSGNGGLIAIILLIIIAGLLEWRTGFFSEALRRYQMGPGISSREDRDAAQQIMLGVQANPIELQVVVGHVVARVETENQATRSILWGLIPLGQTTLSQVRSVQPVVAFKLHSLSRDKIQEVPGPNGKVLIVTVPKPQVIGVNFPIDSVDDRKLEKAFFFFGAGEEQVLKLDQSSDRDAALAALKQFCQEQKTKLNQLLEGENGLQSQLTAYFKRLIDTGEAQVQINFVNPSDGYFIPPVEPLGNYSCKMES